jgi:hypothetical protein
MPLIEVGFLAIVALLCLNLLGPRTRNRLVRSVETTFGRLGGWFGVVLSRLGSLSPVQFVAVVGVCLLASVFFLDLPALFLFCMAFFAVVLFGIAWHREFRFLMQLADADLPGRFDKIIWAALLILLPPVGVVTFGAYRRSTWPEAVKPAMAGDFS